MNDPFRLPSRAPLPYDSGSVVQFNTRYKTGQGHSTAFAKMESWIEGGSITVSYPLIADGNVDGMSGKL
jgi:hypothetical protein